VDKPIHPDDELTPEQILAMDPEDAIAAIMQQLKVSEDEAGLVLESLRGGDIVDLDGPAGPDDQAG